MMSAVLVEWYRTRNLMQEIESSKLGEIPTRKGGKRAKLTLGCPTFPIQCTIKASRTHIQDFVLFRQPNHSFIIIA